MGFCYVPLLQEPTPATVLEQSAEGAVAPTEVAAGQAAAAAAADDAAAAVVEAAAAPAQRAEEETEADGGSVVSAPTPSLKYGRKEETLLLNEVMLNRMFAAERK